MAEKSGKKPETAEKGATQEAIATAEKGATQEAIATAEKGATQETAATADVERVAGETRGEAPNALDEKDVTQETAATAEKGAAGTKETLGEAPNKESMSQETAATAEKNDDDVEATLRILKEEKKREEKAVPKKKIPVPLRIVMVVFFPVTVLVLLFRFVARKISIPLTAKMTIIYTAMFALALVGFTVFVLSSIRAQLPDTESSRQYLGTIVATSAILVVTFIVLFAALGAVSAQYMLKPIRSMTARIDDITSDNLSTRLDQVDSQDELRELTDRINEMLDHLEQSFTRQQNFVADASHELKTPIAVIQGYAGMLRRWGSEKPEILAEGIDAISRESENMKKIVEQLLLLARLGNMNMNNTRFNLVEVVSDMTEDYRLVDKAHKILFEGTGNITVETDKNLLLESVRTLADNAIRYTPAGGSIMISCTLVEMHAEIAVTDTGKGISKEDLPHIFERFYRCDKAHGRESGSNGLGLAIAKSIVEAMHGKIEVVSVPDAGSTFTIKLY